MALIKRSLAKQLFVNLNYHFSNKKTILKEIAPHYQYDNKKKH